MPQSQRQSDTGRRVLRRPVYSKLAEAVTHQINVVVAAAIGARRRWCPILRSFLIPRGNGYFRFHGRARSAGLIAVSPSEHLVVARALHPLLVSPECVQFSLNALVYLQINESPC